MLRLLRQVAALPAGRLTSLIPEACATQCGFNATSWANHTNAARQIYTTTTQSASTSSQHAEQGSAPSTQNLNRLLYRARQRGWLELDLLVGMWAERNLAHLKSDALKDFETLLNEENPDLFKWLTGQIVPPSEMDSNQAFKMIRAEVEATMLAHGSLGANTQSGAEKKEWIRGWDDWQKPQVDADDNDDSNSSK